MPETHVQSLGGEDLLEKDIAIHSSILAWRVPWTEEPGGLWSIGSQRVGHDWVTNHAHMQEKLFLELSLGFLGLLSFTSSFLHFKINIHICCLGFPGSSIGKESNCNARMQVLFTKQCSTLCDPMNCNSTGSSVHGILQARILEWVAIPFSRGIFPTQGLNLGLLHCRQIL